jgi:hypothetical protein
MADAPIAKNSVTENTEAAKPNVKSAENTGHGFDAVTEVHEAVLGVMPAETLGKGAEGDSGAVTTQGSTSKASSQKATFQFVIPSDNETLIKEIDHELNKQLKVLTKQAEKARGGLFRQMDAEKLARVLMQIRKIRQTLSELIHMTSESLRNLYRTLFQPRGL